MHVSNDLEDSALGVGGLDSHLHPTPTPYTHSNIILTSKVKVAAELA